MAKHRRLSEQIGPVLMGAFPFAGRRLREDDRDRDEAGRFIQKTFAAQKHCSFRFAKRDIVFSFGWA
jgi:hypothetical protein